MEQEIIETKNEIAEVTTKAPPPHVPPRIDPEMYQAEVPDWNPENGG